VGTAHRIRLTVGLDWEKLPAFFPGAKTLQGKLNASVGSFPALPVAPSVLLTQIDNAEAAHLATKTSKGLIAARTVQVNILWTSLESDCTYCQGVCNSTSTREQGLALAQASGFHLVAVGDIVKDVIEIKVDVGTGVAHLKAAAGQLQGPSKKKSKARTYLWRHILNGTTVVNDDPSPVASTTISGLPLGATVGFQVAVKDSTGVGEWSLIVPASIH
jgi:hypothetical protein